MGIKNHQSTMAGGYNLQHPYQSAQHNLECFAKHVFYFEEGIERCGVGEHFEHLLHEAGFHGAYVLRAIQGFVRHATMQESLHDLGLDADGIYRTVTDTLQNWK